MWGGERFCAHCQHHGWAERYFVLYPNAKPFSLPFNRTGAQLNPFKGHDTSVFVVAARTWYATSSRVYLLHSAVCSVKNPTSHGDQQRRHARDNEAQRDAQRRTTKARLSSICSRRDVIPVEVRIEGVSFVFPSSRSCIIYFDTTC